MKAQQDVKDAAAEVSRSLDKHLKTRGQSLEERLRKGRKKLPRNLARQADALADAEKRAKYRPDLPVGDTARLTQARDDIAAHLDSIDHKEQRRIARRKWVADLVINLGILGVAITVFYMIGSNN